MALEGKSGPVTLINPPGLYDPSRFAYSHVAVVAPNTRTVYVSGQGGGDLQERYSSDFAEQMHQALLNLKIALEAGGASVSDVARLTILVVGSNYERLGQFGAAMNVVFGPGPKPTGTLIPVERLARPDMLVEIDAIAHVAS